MDYRNIISILDDYLHKRSMKYKPFVLQVDGFTAHITDEVILRCEKKNIHLFVLHPHSSHMTQMMDQIPLLSSKRHFEKTCNELTKSKLFARPSAEIVQSFANSLFKGCTNVHIIDGFKNAGWFDKSFKPERFKQFASVALMSPAEKLQPDERYKRATTMFADRFVNDVKASKSEIYEQIKRDSARMRRANGKKKIGEVTNEENIAIINDLRKKIQMKTNEIKANQNQLQSEQELKVKVKIEDDSAKQLRKQQREATKAAWNALTEEEKLAVKKAKNKAYREQRKEQKVDLGQPKKLSEHESNVNGFEALEHNPQTQSHDFEYVDEITCALISMFPSLPSLTVDSITLCSSFMNVSQSDVLMIYHELIRVEKLSGIDMYGRKLENQDMLQIVDTQFINNSIINAFLSTQFDAKIAKSTRNVVICSTSFYSSISREYPGFCDEADKHLKNTYYQKAGNYQAGLLNNFDLHASHIVIVIHKPGHWIWALIKCDTKEIFVIDPLYDSYDDVPPILMEWLVLYIYQFTFYDLYRVLFLLHTFIYI